MTTTACPSCRTEVRVDLSSVPAGRAARVTCPSCKTAYPVTPGPASAAPPAPAPAVATAPGPPAITAEDRAWLRRELEALRAEVERQVTANVLSAMGVTKAAAGPAERDPEQRNALVCEADPQFAQLLCSILTEKGYLPQVVSDMRSAWRALDREWGVITVTESLPDDAEAGMKLQERLSRLPGEKRRRIFVMHVSNEVRSLDGGMAFVLNANVTLNRGDAQHAREIVTKGMSDYERMYRLFHEAKEAMNA
jgi:predicted Zn finger-like uncharacterized protein